MNCTQAQPLLSAYHDGELSPEERFAMRQHLVTCSRCAEELSRFEALSHMALSLRESRSPELWGEIEAVLDLNSEAVAPAPLKVSGRDRTQLPRGVWWATGIAAAAIVAGIVLFWWPKDPRHDHAQMQINLAQYVDTFASNPEQAQRLLQEQYTNRTVQPDELFMTVNYHSLAPETLPGGLRRTSQRVFDMPCCKCVQSLYSAPNQPPLAIFEHVDKEPMWFGSKPRISTNCGGHDVEVVQCGKELCASWKVGDRFITLVGVQDLDQLTATMGVLAERG